MSTNDSSTSRSLEVWEDIYQAGHTQRYPWDIVVSFVFRNAPKGKPRNEVKILEVGFGTGSNLWFAAREGFSVAGVEGSETAVEYARKRFAEEGLEGDLRVGDFTQLPFADEEFDLVVDREALTCAGRDALIKAIAEIRRVLKPGGRFLYNGYADTHSSYRSGRLDEYDRKTDIDAGTLVGIGPVLFVSRSDIDRLFGQGWKLLQVQRREWTNMLHPCDDIHAEWAVIAEKT